MRRNHLYNRRCTFVHGDCFPVFHLFLRTIIKEYLICFNKKVKRIIHVFSIVKMISISWFFSRKQFVDTWKFAHATIGNKFRWSRFRTVQISSGVCLFHQRNGQPTVKHITYSIYISYRSHKRFFRSSYCSFWIRLSSIAYCAPKESRW